MHFSTISSIFLATVAVAAPINPVMLAYDAAVAEDKRANPVMLAYDAKSAEEKV
jgi:hypothetical protein